MTAPTTDVPALAERIAAGALLYVWNAAAGRYRSLVTGRFVTAAVVRAALDAALVNAAAEIRAASTALRSRQITLQAWRLTMRESIKGVHLYSTALAKGGWAQLSPADYERIGETVREQYTYLERFTRQLQDGTAPLDGRFLGRTELYAEAGRKTYHSTISREQEIRGMSEERNVLHPADHCTGDGSCVEEAAKAWQPIGTLIPVGERICGARCKCTLEYRAAS